MKISYKFEEENQIVCPYYQRDTKLVLKFDFFLQNGLQDFICSRTND